MISAGGVRGRSPINRIASTASLRVRCWSSSRVTGVVMLIRNPQSQLPPLYIEPLLIGDPSLLVVEITLDQRQHRLDFLRLRPRVQRSSQMRMQLLGGAEHRGRRHRAELAPFEIEARPPDDLAVRDRKSTRLNSSHFVPSRMP